MEISSIPHLIKIARNGRNQAEFARVLGVSQSALCRYEKGKANPKTDVIEHCMRLVHWGDLRPDTTVEELATKVRSQLARDDQAPLRKALSKIIDGLISEKEVAHNMIYRSS